MIQSFARMEGGIGPPELNESHSSEGHGLVSCQWDLFGQSEETIAHFMFENILVALSCIWYDDDNTNLA